MEGRNNTRLMRPILIIIILIMCLQAPALSAVQYSPGPSNREDANGNRYSVQHAIEYDAVSGGVYTYNSRLYVNVRFAGDIADCGHAAIDFLGNTDLRYFTSSPYPLTFNNTPTWSFSYYNTTHLWVSGTGGGYVRYSNLAGETPCNGFGVPWMAGWISAVNTSYQWQHILVGW